MRWKYPFLTACCLVLLRLAIGWHFCFEGYHKVHSLSVGPVVRDGRTVPPFSSAGYFSEARGPLGSVMRQAIGDPDRQLLERLTLAPPPEAQKTSPENEHTRMPPALARDWEAYLSRFAAHYSLDDKQHEKARAKLQEAEAKFIHWLTADKKAIERNYPSGTVQITESNEQRIKEYRAALDEVRDVYSKELPAFGRDVEKARLQKTKAGVVEQRKSLQTDLDEQTQKMHQALAEVLTEDQRKRDAVAPDVTHDEFLHRLDVGTAWFLFGVGATLLFGLFTRASCLLAAGFLLLTYVSVPPFPWLPAPPQQEGSYYFISKNVIEMLALLTLATTPSGRWFGIDAMLHQMWRAMFGAKRVSRQ
jgi:uncharacterized membrane protein YphA (DoxX/SURF4 family)